MRFLSLCLFTTLLGGVLSAQDPKPLGPPVSVQPPKALTVMSFNIRNGLAKDGVNHWDKRKQDVLATIRAHEPQLVGLQEAYHFQLEYLTAALPGYTLVGVGRDGGEKGEYSCLLIETKRLEVRRSGTFWLSEKPEQVASKGWDAALPRICTWAVLREHGSLREFLVMNAHFDHRGKVARLRSAELMHARLADFEGLPVIVTGDLNQGEASKPLSALKGELLVDSFRVAHPKSSPAGTFNGFAGKRDGAKIDYVLCSKEWTVQAASIDRREFEGRMPSDHYPVVAKLQL
ncbi:MAG: endonuclease/exonuclease/phosphatase family metal-dependent hydrolase [Planctomycetota bacterium]|jgi:endonuclease/exonuclease/phosphatase family metal-dependent hydrolase